MRVLYINETFRNYGPGPAVHGWRLVQEMRARGVEVDLFPPVAEGHATVTPSPHPMLRQWLRARLPGEFLNFLSAIQRTVRRILRAWVQARCRLPDVILARHAAYDWTPWLVARLLARPLVLEVNAAMHLEKELVGVSPPSVLRWMEWVQWRRATRIHTVSKELVPIVAAAGVPLMRICPIPNGADPLPLLDRSRDATLPVQVLFVGGFYPWHGIEHLLRAIASLGQAACNVRLVLIGGGPASRSVGQLVSDLGISDLVEMPGRISHERVREYLRRADIAVAPYPRLEPFYFSPLKIFEYMAAGLPTVASEQGQMAEVLEHGKTGLLYPPGDIRALASSLLYLTRNPDHRLQMGEMALAVLKSQYTWAHTAGRILELCRDALGDTIQKGAHANGVGDARAIPMVDE